MPALASPLLADRAFLSGLSGALPLVGPGHPVLRQAARELAPDAIDSPELRRVVVAMWRTLDAAESGVGLAAPQVGLSIALFLVDDREGHRFAIVNPRPAGLPSFATQVGPEGCLSLPDYWGQVVRPVERAVQGLTPEGQPLLVMATGFLARILAHESDHLAGRLYADLALPGTLEPEFTVGTPGGAVWRTQRERPAH